MSVPKFKAAAVGLLMAMAGIGSAIMIYRAMAGKPSRALPPPPVPYSPATPVAEDVAIPDNFSVFFPVLTVVVLPERFPREPESYAASCTASRSLPARAVVVTDPPDTYAATAALFRETFAQAEKGELRVKAGCGLSVLAVGPRLEPSAQFECRQLTCRGKRIEVEVAHTAGVPPRTEQKIKEEPWRPMVVIPLLLRAGSYQLKVTWRAMDNIREGKPLPGDPLVQTCSFAAPEGVVESAALRVHGVDFQTLVDTRRSVPKEGHRCNLHLGLRVTNRGDKELLFEPAAVHLMLDSLRTAKGCSLRYGGGRDGTMVSKPVPIAPGRSRIFVVRGELGWFKDRQIQGGWHKGGTGLFLSGVIGSGDTFWYYDGLTAGKYRLCLDYHVSDRPASFWTGRVRTQDAEFEIVP